LGLVPCYGRKPGLIMHTFYIFVLAQDHLLAPGKKR
jgi:hypothetical protein